MYKQLIIARKDLNMSPGKLAAQVSHASIAFLLEKILWGSKEVVRERDGIIKGYFCPNCGEKMKG